MLLEQSFYFQLHESLRWSCGRRSWIRTYAVVFAVQVLRVTNPEQPGGFFRHILEVLSDGAVKTHRVAFFRLGATNRFTEIQMVNSIHFGQRGNKASFRSPVSARQQ